MEISSEISKIKLTSSKTKRISEVLINEEMNLIVTPKEIDEDINNLSEVISYSLNIALHKNYEDL